MYWIERTLAGSYDELVNLDYPSRDYPIERLASDYLAPSVARCRSMYSGPVHLVSHSLGGILIRQYLQSHSLPAGSRVVMLSPPNHGSEVADYFADHRWFKTLLGPAAQQLTTGPAAFTSSLNRIPVEVGVITGRKTLEPWLSSLLPGEDDGKVSVESAKLDEMTDFLVLDTTHTLINFDCRVSRAIKTYLRDGQFRPPASEPEDRP